MMNKITILGSGTSTGVPILGCNCRVCKSTEKKNKRFRTSALIETANAKTILIDASPDLRTQLLSEDVQKIDAAIITHDHADHTHGLDDLRPFGFKQAESIPVITHSGSATSLREKFPYIFDKEKVFGDRPILGGGLPQLHLEEVTPGEHKVMEESFFFSLLPHGHTETFAIRHNKLGYIIDCNKIDEHTLNHFESARLELLVIDCLRLQPHSTHLHLDLSLEYIARIAPKTAILTHLGHEWDYHELIKELRVRRVKNIFPAVDGESYLYS